MSQRLQCLFGCCRGDVAAPHVGDRRCVLSQSEFVLCRLAVHGIIKIHAGSVTQYRPPIDQISNLKNNNKIIGEKANLQLNERTYERSKDEDGYNGADNQTGYCVRISALTLATVCKTRFVFSYDQSRLMRGRLHLVDSVFGNATESVREKGVTVGAGAGEFRGTLVNLRCRQAKVRTTTIERLAVVGPSWLPVRMIDVHHHWILQLFFFK